MTGKPQETFYDLLAIPSSPKGASINTGNEITTDLKRIVRAARLNSIHISPTVVFDGVVDDSVSSGWSVEQWEVWLQKNVV